MGCLCSPKSKLTGLVSFLQLAIGGVVIVLSVSSLFRLYSLGFFAQHDDICRHFYGSNEADRGIDLNSLRNRVEEVLDKMASLQSKLESRARNKANFSTIELENDVIEPLYEAHIALRQIRLPRVDNDSAREDPLINYFGTEELKRYIGSKPNRHRRGNVYKTSTMRSSIGHNCVLMKKQLDEYMDYEVGSVCKDDWVAAQKMMLDGCDPLPRRRCLARAPKTYSKPFPKNESLWKVPDARNVQWSSYKCKDFKCLSSKNPNRGFVKCANCFEIEKERLKWVTNTTVVEFSIREVLAMKPGEVRIGLDYGIGTGTFAARMWDEGVTIVSTAINAGAPFSEMIALRGLVPLYVTPNQRLPFFDNTLDLIHTSGFLDGWIDFLVLDFVLFDWDRVLRPGGLLWIDKFFCNRADLEDYMYMFLKFRYKKHRWVVASKSKGEVYLSAVLEKPPRSL